MSCQCTTLKNERCKNPVKAGTNFCYRHLGCVNVFGVAKAKAAKAKVSPAKVAKAKVVAKAKAVKPKAKTVKPKAKTPPSSPKFDRFADLPAPVLDQILMDMSRKDLNVLCNSNPRIKRLLCDNPGWRNRYNAKNPEGVFHENSHFVMSHGHHPNRLVFNELRDVRPEEGPLGYREMLNNFVVSVTIDKIGDVVTNIYYFHDAVRAQPGSDVATTSAYVELKGLRPDVVTMTLRLASSSAKALDEFLAGIGKMHWKPYFIHHIHFAGAGVPGFQHYIGRGKAVEEFYDIVKKQIGKIEMPEQDVIIFPKITTEPKAKKEKGKAKAKKAKKAKAKAH